ncbi:MAG: hypothetical protein AAF570_28995, partial [Bacteroidota bacterium]
LAWFFMPASFKVFLKVPVEVAAARIMGDASRKREKYRDLAHAVEDLTARKASENRRFLDKYNADCANMDNFDCVIDTSKFTPEEVGKQIVESFRAWADRQPA